MLLLIPKVDISVASSRFLAGIFFLGTSRAEQARNSISDHRYTPIKVFLSFNKRSIFFYPTGAWIFILIAYAEPLKSWTVSETAVLRDYIFVLPLVPSVVPYLIENSRENASDGVNTRSKFPTVILTATFKFHI